jgi:hypothetical protein
MTTIELTRFRVEPAREADLLRARPAMLADFRADLPGIGAFLASIAELISAEEGDEPALAEG